MDSAHAESAANSTLVDPLATQEVQVHSRELNAMETIPQRVSVFGEEPPLLSQEVVHPCAQAPSYRWEATSPVDGRSSGMYVLAWGSPPPNQPRWPLSRDPPNLLVNRKGLRAALRGALRGRGARGTRHEGRLEATSAATPNEGRIAPPSGRSRGCRGGRGGRGRGAVRSSWGEQQVSKEAPVGWEPPTILSNRTSPILLRRRVGLQHQLSPAEDGELDITNITNITSISNSEIGEAFHTPPRGQSLQRHSSGGGTRALGVHGSAVCRHSIIDFHPGRSPPHTILRQSVGEFEPWLHNCGEVLCPFTEPPVAERRATIQEEQCAMLAGQILSHRASPQTRIRVDDRAYPFPVHVEVTLEVLGINSAEWGDLAKFKGTVINRYYRETDGTPMFTVDFGGGIGQQEVRVRDASLDHHAQWPYLQPRTLDFGEGPLNTTGSGGSA
jgi:hypothetical protein